MPDAEERTIGVAVAVPDPYGPELQSRRASFGDPLASSIPAHITLVPPTRVPAPMIEDIDRHLRGVALRERPFHIHLRGTGTFRPVSPVVFVALAEGIGDCERLEYEVRRGPLAVERAFPYHPHVTVAHHLPDDLLDQAFKELAAYEAEFPVDGFSLYEHGLDGVWRPRWHFPFGGRAYRS
ncbi:MULTISPECIES: 2'-5' RNA ligase family protein [Actinoallomurus]|uniref:2'-5' RNA ligase family protein n=1 Tax=Actinoallomurus TaxID=667113 RepID=UPI00209292AE|nr:MULTISPECIES: 2'-5' RNA ligase family protein [Actinoallomurus]MCO5969365.1 2'-5' RNA ligase family protein [Actinoallomurus soli]MCO5999206.1 2'-5' RNA ligase family protein [Actinoallomurus rhizosphaericola]